VVFPEYYFGQIFEAQQEPEPCLQPEHAAHAAAGNCQGDGAQRLQEGRDRQWARRKQWPSPLFGQSQLAMPRDYVVTSSGCLICRWRGGRR